MRSNIQLDFTDVQTEDSLEHFLDFTEPARKGKSDQPSFYPSPSDVGYRWMNIFDTVVILILYNKI